MSRWKYKPDRLKKMRRTEQNNIDKLRHIQSLEKHLNRKVNGKQVFKETDWTAINKLKGLKSNQSR
tara:strand:+ start:12554 stop:12751 length:198 start_codon:yes stop_codon:yes gene_type:complete